MSIKFEYQNINPSIRMGRFNKAFKEIFDDSLTFDKIDNINNKKDIQFKKWDHTVSIDALSSGEKQIVYRGSFILKDINAINGAFVLVDEPEISMHPEWQQKMYACYKNLVRDSNGVQT